MIAKGSRLDYHTLKKINKKAGGGKNLISLLITEDNRKKLSTYLKSRLKERMRRRAFKDRASNLRDLVRSAERHITPVTQPLMLIFDLPTSGGALLNQLFDGHPQLHVHPGEIMLTFAEQKKSISPSRRPDPVKRPHKWFSILAQNRVNGHLEEVQKKLDIVDSSQPMVFIPYLQRRIFLRYLKSMKSRSLRTLCDAYMTSYFGSWLNYANLYRPDKKFIVGYSKIHTKPRKRMKQFMEIYPDGKIAFIIRNPKNWSKANSLHQDKSPLHTRSAIDHWHESTEAMIRIKEAFDSRVCIIQHKDLLGNTEAVMRHFCQFLSIDFDHLLLNPSFNGFKVKSLDYAEIGEAPKDNPSEQSDAAQLKGLDTNWPQTLDKYETAVSKSVQL